MEKNQCGKGKVDWELGNNDQQVEGSSRKILELCIYYQFKPSYVFRENTKRLSLAARTLVVTNSRRS